MSVKTTVNVRVVSDGYREDESLRELVSEIAGELAATQGTASKLAISSVPSRWQGWGPKYTATFRVTREGRRR